MIGVLVISHEPLGTSLIHCTRHIFGRMSPQLAALDVIPDEDTAEAIAAARSICAKINDGSGVLVLTDVMGATPSRIAAALAVPHKIVVIAGVNLPLLVKALTHRRGTELEALVDRLLPAAREAITTMLPGTFEPTTTANSDKVASDKTASDNTADGPNKRPGGSAEDKNS